MKDLCIVFTLVVIAVAMGCATKGKNEFISVSAQEEWSAATHSPLTAGSKFIIEVQSDQQWTSGKWTGTADGGQPQWGDYALPGAPAYSLIGRIGKSGEPFYIGSRYEGVADNDGVLQLAMNDVPGTYWDNRGDLRVVVTVH